MEEIFLMRQSITKVEREWRNIQREWNEPKELSIPKRVTEKGKPFEYEIHTFLNASERAYSAVVYLKYRIEERYYLELLFSKNRLCPAKAVSIPRLELLELLIRTRATLYFKRELHLQLMQQTICRDCSQNSKIWRVAPVSFSPIVSSETFLLLSLL